MSIDAKTPQNTSKSNPIAHQKRLHHDRVRFIPGVIAWLNAWKSIYVMPHAHIIENETNATISIGTKKE
jgi:hypothetical protein